jgi:hypothetical protein
MNFKIKSILITLCVLTTFNTYAVSFTADAVQIRGAEVSHAKMFWHDGSVRFEYLDQGVAMVQIFDNENNKVIWLDAEKKVYIERELSDRQATPVTSKTANNYNPCDEFPDAECTRLKAADINDRQTDKWLITFTVENRDQHVFQWIDKKHQIVVRQQNPDGSVLNVQILDDQEVNGRQVRKVDMMAVSADGSSVHGIQWYDSELDIVVRQQADDGAIDELRNIMVGQVESALFTIPEGYKTVDAQLTDLDSKPAIIFGTTNNKKEAKNNNVDRDR